MKTGGLTESQEARVISHSAPPASLIRMPGPVFPLVQGRRNYFSRKLESQRYGAWRFSGEKQWVWGLNKEN